MPRKLRPGDRVDEFAIEEELSAGAMAISYRAKQSAAGSDRLIFLKQFISPTTALPWYGDFCAYQDRMKTLIEKTELGNLVCKPIKFFESQLTGGSPATRGYYQAFEFISDGKDLETVLKELEANPASANWGQRTTWAKVIMGSIGRLHHHKVVHADLKPANLQLIKDDTIKIGYKLKLIDMDRSVMLSERIPWDGHEGQTGTPGYFSPEHLRKEPLLPASDVFTCGLILYELLAGGHPYKSGGPDDYQKAVESHAAPPPGFEGPIGEGFDRLVHKMLSPRAGDRPTAEEVKDALNRATRSSGPPRSPAPPKGDAPARAGSEAPAPPAASGSGAGAGGTREARPEPAPAPASAPRAPEPPKTVGPALVLVAGDRRLPVAIKTRLNGRLLAGVPDADRYWDSSHQATVERRGLEWWLLPNPAAANETMLNGAKVVEPVKLSQGDVLAVGREAKGITKAPVTVEFA